MVKGVGDVAFHAVSTMYYILHCVVLCCIALCCISLCCTVLHCTVLYCIRL